MGRDRSNDRRLNVAQISARLGIKPKTWTGYKARPPKHNPIPAPIPFEDGQRRQPEWWESDIEEWQRRRVQLGGLGWRGKTGPGTPGEDQTQTQE